MTPDEKMEFLFATLGRHTAELALAQRELSVRDRRIAELEAHLVELEQMLSAVAGNPSTDGRDEAGTMSPEDPDAT